MYINSILDKLNIIYMKLLKIIYTYAPLFLTSLISCNQAPKKKSIELVDSIQQTKAPISVKLIDDPKDGTPVIPASGLLKDFTTFWNYYTQNVKLNQDFAAYNSKGETITKEALLKQLKTGLYYPLRVFTKSADFAYQLQEIPAKADSFIPDYMKQFSVQELKFYSMQGKEIPAFHFTTIDGQSYTNANTKGKIVLFKCWFISCLPCVQEMPALNQLVEKYKDRNDILFISLATDGKKALKDFLNKTKFDYETVSDQKRYMVDKLNVSAYPTHFLINKEGKLVRALYNDKEVAEAIEKEIKL